MLGKDSVIVQSGSIISKSKISTKEIKMKDKLFQRNFHHSAYVLKEAIDYFNTPSNENEEYASSYSSEPLPTSKKEKINPIIEFLKDSWICLENTTKALFFKLFIIIIFIIILIIVPIFLWKKRKDIKTYFEYILNSISAKNKFHENFFRTEQEVINLDILETDRK